jgi:hypothetical protein
LGLQSQHPSDSELMNTKKTNNRGLRFHRFSSTRAWSNDGDSFFRKLVFQLKFCLYLQRFSLLNYKLSQSFLPLKTVITKVK